MPECGAGINADRSLLQYSLGLKASDAFVTVKASWQGAQVKGAQ